MNKAPDPNKETGAFVYSIKGGVVSPLTNANLPKSQALEASLVMRFPILAKHFFDHAEIKKLES